MLDSTMTAPPVNNGSPAKPQSSNFTEVLREMLKTLDIKDVTPEVIIQRFNKSGGIDRVRIAIERRMKKATDIHHQRTKTASEKFLSDTLPEGTTMLHPQKLMQTAQDAVLASVKDRIEQDVDAVTEKGQASWFLECVRDEIVNTCKEESTIVKNEQPARPSKVVDGAKAILKNLSRNVVRAKQAEHVHDSARLNGNREYSKGESDKATNGKKQPEVSGHKRHEDLKNETQKDANITEEPVKNDEGKKMDNSLPSREEVLDSFPQASEQRDFSGPSSDEAVPNGYSRKKSSETVAEDSDPKEEVQPTEDKEEEKDYDAIADEILLGGGTDEETEEKEAETTKPKQSLSDSKPTEKISSSDAKLQSKETNADTKVGPSEISGGSGPPLSSEKKCDIGISTKQLDKDETPEPQKSLAKIASSEEAPKASHTDLENLAKASSSPQEDKVLIGSLDTQEQNTPAENSQPSRRADPPSRRADPLPASKQSQGKSGDSQAPQSAAEGVLDKSQGETSKTIKKLEARSKDELIEGDAKGTSSATDVAKAGEVPNENEDTHPHAKEKEEDDDLQCAEAKKEEVASLAIPDAKRPSKREKGKSAQNRASDTEEPTSMKEDNSAVSPRKESDTANTDEEQRRSSKVEDAQTTTRKAKSPTRRASRRLSSRTAQKRENVDISDDSDAQKRTTQKKDKRTAAGTKRKAESKPKVTKSDNTKNSKESVGRKRRRGQSTDEVEPPCSRAVDQSPDPAVGNWPRGYGTVRSCVPEDFDMQQRVLSALEILLQKDCATPFSEAVDTSEEGLEMYASIIKNPMDLGEVCRRLRNSTPESAYYLNVTEVMQDVGLVWWNCKRYNGQYDPIIRSSEESQFELTSLLEGYGLQIATETKKRRRMSRRRVESPEKDEDSDALGDNDGRLVGKTILIFTELVKGKKEWFSVEVKSYDVRTKSYTLLWTEKKKTTKKATFGQDMMYPVYRT